MKLPKQTWRERFDKEFCGQYKDFGSLCCKGEYCTTQCGIDQANTLKSFIAQIIEEERERLVGEIENMEKYQCPDLYSQPDNDELLLMSKIINLIKK